MLMLYQDVSVVVEDGASDSRDGIDESQSREGFAATIANESHIANPK